MLYQTNTGVPNPLLKIYGLNLIQNLWLKKSELARNALGYSIYIRCNLPVLVVCVVAVVVYVSGYKLNKKKKQQI